MRILMTADAAGGVGVFAGELRQALKARGHEVRMVVFSPGRPPLRTDGEQIWAPFRLEWMDGSGEAASLAAEAEAGRAFLREVARPWQPDILHSNHFAYCGALAGVPTVLTVHSDVISWWHWVRGVAPPDNAYQRWYAQLARKAQECAAVVVTPSQAARSDILTHLHGTRAVEVIPNGRKPVKAPSGSKQPAALAAGRLWDAGKGIEMLGGIDGGGLEMLVAGERRHPLESWEAAVPAGARWLGSLPAAELQDWMAQVRVYIGTSVYEPFGLAVLEAAWSGCALLLRDIESWRELWGPAAAFYANASELGQLLQRAAREPDWAEDLGRAARWRAQQRYTAARMAQAYEHVYQQAKDGC